jgi:iodothyronine deiodinase-like protein
VQFIAVYLREAHPADGWTMGKDKLSKSILQPKTVAERSQVAVKCCSTLKISMPMVVDDIDDRIGHAYSGMPDRLYIINSAGKIAYQGGRGPFCYLPSEMEQSLVMLLMEERAAKAATPSPKN